MRRIEEIKEIIVAGEVVKIKREKEIEIVIMDSEEKKKGFKEFIEVWKKGVRYI